jgi:hypothetical protein|eukprot:CAMPEP_0169098090 /NCGR_PEP_ID=MMETSP1015-20121227/19853_1 /TAXON_ID=342587 /ORGANISM="Karlodinium micrum, Strain CCMP2283" /LENGTH=499 /DNA_ID=CAMNT_0009158911 /DNA_START=67 /DNA_END=1566 /DNA_ORIENTATION=+
MAVSIRKNNELRVFRQLPTQGDICPVKAHASMGVKAFHLVGPSRRAQSPHAADVVQLGASIGLSCEDSSYSDKLPRTSLVILERLIAAQSRNSEPSRCSKVSADSNHQSSVSQAQLPNLLSAPRPSYEQKEHRFIADAVNTLCNDSSQKLGKGDSLQLPRSQDAHHEGRGSVNLPAAPRCLLPRQPTHPLLPPDAAVALSSEQMETRLLKCRPGAALGRFGRSPEQVTKLVQVVSLGNSCGTKLSIRRVGLDEATFPFDWIRSSIDGLMHWLEHDFEGFFSADKKHQVIMQGCSMTVFRSRTHSFWHDDLNDAATLEKLHRRVDRFLNLAVDSVHGSPRTLLFVRSVACSDELTRVDALLDLLQHRFESPGRKVLLLVIIDGQPFSAPVIHANRDGLLFWLQPTFLGSLKSDCSEAAPYEEAIAFVVDRIVSGSAEPKERDWLRVRSSQDLVRKDGPLWHLGVRSTDCGLWVGKVLLSGASMETMFAAFEGIPEEGQST